MQELLSLPTRPSKNYIQVLTIEAFSFQISKVENIHTSVFSLINFFHAFLCWCFSQFREDKAIPALPLWALGIRCQCRPDWTVGVVPLGCGTSAHADSRSYRFVLQHHSGNHAWDRDSRGSYTRTVQRPEHELGERARCSGDKFHHIRHYAQPFAQIAPDGQLYPLNHVGTT